MLDRAARAMDAAAKHMEERKAKAADQQLVGAPFEKEELDAENKADEETRKRQRKPAMASWSICWTACIQARR